MKLNYKTIVINVAVTFVEGFVGTLLATGNHMSKQVIGGAVAAGISLAWNTTLKPYLKTTRLYK